MSAGDKLFGRLLNRHPPPPPEPQETLRVHSFGLQMQLDAEGRIVQLSGPLRHLLTQQSPGTQAPHLLDFLLPHSSLVIEGVPADWQGQTLDLDFYSLNGPPLHLRGWVQPLADAWLLQMLDIGDLLLERRQSRNREQCQVLAMQITEQLRLCSLTRLPEMLGEQLQNLAQRFQIPCIALALLDEQAQGWQIHQHYAALDAPQLWQNGQRLGTGLDSLSGSTPQHLTLREHPRLQETFGNTDGFAVPYHDAQGVVAWLLCGLYTAHQRAPDVTERDWLQITAALASPLLERLREHRHHLQLERLESLQALLGTGWWEVFSDSDELQLAPSLATTLNLGATRLSVQDLLDKVYPADREELRIRLQDLQVSGMPLLLCVRLYHPDGAPEPIWYRLQGQSLGVGKKRRLVGFMLDISDIKSQEQSAARVVDHMRVFGRRSEIEQQQFNPALAIEGARSLLSEGMRGKGIDLRIIETGFEVQVRGHVNLLEQVLINLTVNARDALLGKRETQPGFNPWISLYAERDTRSVRLWVEDNGGGIDPRLLERTFEPFFTTRPVGVGTGLGLSVSYGIVENMGGKLSVSNSTEGARFCIELPIVLPDQISSDGRPE
ncbi:ATP-binding protein [Pseudomonas sp. B28(2017)]|uniref:ATP-binding protein n=1 Tax=Pseudomonas sp. B28(2017) TaxID=1981730 RepID=UPI000A1EABEB|nr:ATP-binding protein [Pseudomonas sp. B28(2017)]